jgi:hypothetical protein
VHLTGKATPHKLHAGITCSSKIVGDQYALRPLRFH